LHDSRRGLSAYYRYQPRKIGARVNPPDPTTLLMQDPDPKTRALLTSVKIHDSVLQRIQHGTDRYAPIVLPRAYAIVSTNGSAPGPLGESSAVKRAEAQERVWDRVWHKRVNYFATVAVSAYLGLLPVWHLLSPPTACVGPQCLLAPAIYGAGELLPGVAQPWVNAFATTPGRAAAALLVITVLLGRSRRLQTRSRDDMRALWEESLNLRTVTTVPSPPQSWIRRLRGHRRYQRFFQVLKWTALPAVFGIALLAATVVVVATPLAVGVVRAGIWMAEYSNVWCRGASGRESSSRNPCLPLGADVDGGKRYRITVTVKEPWRDRTIDTDVGGFAPARMGFFGYAAAPLRRSLSARWFQPMVKIVPAQGVFAVVPLEMQRVDVTAPRYTAQFTAPKDGRVYFFVNDVLLPSWVWEFDRYTNNIGSATIDLERVVPPKSERATPGSS
jgi:hypothetical protein